ncbi:MAG: hypothetical protein HQ552_07200 [Desulfobacteraceae bacterium]|nr:hypothetical protein [Desulfobacteraceae bacterium]
MPNIEYDTRTPDDKKKLLRRKRQLDNNETENNGKITKDDSVEVSSRDGLHRHSA